jgi:guanosine-3',5'-bis(diphosphate) 3'-pyrophosphohydrolase
VTHVADRAACGGVTVRLGRQQHSADHPDSVGCGRPKPRSEPSLDHGVRHRRHSLAKYEVHAGLPRRCGWLVCARVAKGEAYDAFGTVSGSPHPYINHPIAVANVLANEAGITDPTILAAALLHDTIEDTATTAQELEAEFGTQIAAVVAEVTDDKYLPKKERKRRQIEHAATLSEQAKLVKLADKICKVRDMSRSPVVNWSLERKAEYFSWAKQVVDAMRGVSPVLESLFDKEFAGRSFGSKQ